MLFSIFHKVFCKFHITICQYVDLAVCVSNHNFYILLIEETTNDTKS